MDLDKLYGYVQTMHEVEAFLRYDFVRPNFTRDTKTMWRLVDDIDEDYSFDEIEKEMLMNTKGRTDNVTEYKNIIEYKRTQYKDPLQLASDILGAKLDKVDHDSLHFRNNWRGAIKGYLSKKGITDWDMNELYTNALCDLLDACSWVEWNLRSLLGCDDDEMFDDMDGAKMFWNTMMAKHYTKLYELLAKHNAIPKTTDKERFVRVVRSGKWGVLYSESESKNKLVVAIKEVCKRVIDRKAYKNMISESIGMSWDKMSKRTVEDKEYIENLCKIME